MKNETKLGKCPLENDGRDAVHIAIVPVVAGALIVPGERVKLKEGLAFAASDNEDPVGVSDPFMPSHVNAGERFWLCLYPSTITSLRHVWQHPAFPVVEKTEPNPASVESVQESARWIERYVSRYCPCYADFGMSKLEACEAFMQNIREGIFFLSGKGCHSSEDVPQKDELYFHLGVVLGKRVDDGFFESFSCSC